MVERTSMVMRAQVGGCDGSTSGGTGFGKPTSAVGREQTSQNEKVEMVVREWPRMREPDLYRDAMFRFLRRWEVGSRRVGNDVRE